MEEELSECGSQPSTTMQMVPQPIQMVPAAAPMPLPTAAAASNEQILQQQQQTPHMIPVTTGGAIMPIDSSLTPQTTPQHQVQQQPTVTGGKFMFIAFKIQLLTWQHIALSVSVYHFVLDNILAKNSHNCYIIVIVVKLFF